jgi:hypothetical protein
MGRFDWQSNGLGGSAFFTLQSLELGSVMAQKVLHIGEGFSQSHLRVYAQRHLILSAQRFGHQDSPTRRERNQKGIKQCI